MYSIFVKGKEKSIIVLSVVKIVNKEELMPLAGRTCKDVFPGNLAKVSKVKSGGARQTSAPRAFRH